MMLRLLSLALLLAAFGPARAQKIEIEKKVKASDLPAAVLPFLAEKYPDRGRTKYYLEGGSDTTNFEAKFKWEGDCYSVEFFQDGTWKDAEKEVDLDDLPAPLQQQVAQRLDSDFRKAKVKRVQEQRRPGHPELRYEMEVKGKDPGGWQMYEYLFAADGSLVQQQKILLPSNNITLY